MDNILLCTNHLSAFTAVHNTFIEKYMMNANGSYVKVYLYLIKCIQSGEADLSISCLADKMENTEKDVIRALNYWEKKGLLRITRGEDKVILGIDVLNPDESKAEGQVLSKSSSRGTETQAASRTERETEARTVSPAERTSGIQTASLTDAGNNIETVPAESPASAEPEVIATVDIPSKKPSAHPAFRVTPEQTRRLAKNSDFAWICQVVESYLERPVKPNEIQLLSYLYDNLHFSPDLILYLYEYCISLGKTNVNYIQSVALSWDEKKVKTPEDAANASTSYNTCYTAIAKAFALGRGLAAIEKTFVDRWQNEWNMDFSVILEACNRTMLKIQKADFKYTEGILDNWHKANIHTLQDVEKADEIYARNKAAHRQNRPQSSPSGSTQKDRSKSSYSAFVQHGLSQDDADQLEKQLLNMH